MIVAIGREGFTAILRFAPHQSLLGKKVKEKAATLTVALRKSEAGWRITGWSYSKP